MTGEGEEWNVEGRRRRAAQKYLRDSPTDHWSHGSNTAAVAASKQLRTYATFAYNVKMPVKLAACDPSKNVCVLIMWE